SNGGLVDVDHFVEVVEARDFVVRSRFVVWCAMKSPLRLAAMSSGPPGRVCMTLFINSSLIDGLPARSASFTLYPLL
ncbi:MAG: hypothetical protein EBU46_19180, partial [Nitrosomonadaceae bacterium]|nr:hypothetical protein [Nitrosomonadaceae bacterium]